MPATLTQDEKRQSQTYRMPHVTVAMPVLWYSDGKKSGKPFAALVTEIGGRTVNLTVLGPSPNVKPVTGVRHADDPQAKDADFQLAGAWDYTDEYKNLRRLLNAAGICED